MEDGSACLNGTNLVIFIGNLILWLLPGAHPGFSQGGRFFSHIVASRVRKINQFEFEFSKFDQKVFSEWINAANLGHKYSRLF